MSRRTRRQREARPSKGDLREQAILDGTERLLAQCSFDDLTMADIAREASLRGPSSLYFYFDSKQSVLLGLLDRMHTLFMAPMDASADGLPVNDLIRASILHGASAWRSHGPTLRTFFEAGMRPGEFGDRWRAVISESIDVVVERASADPVAVEALAWMTHHSLFEFHRGSSHARADEQRVVETLIDLWLRGLAVEPGA